MTRDEAIRAASHAIDSGGNNAMEKWVNVFVALGMLKLDEPKTPERKLRDAVYNEYNSVDAFILAIERAGLAIVEK